MIVHKIVNMSEQNLVPISIKLQDTDLIKTYLAHTTSRETKLVTKAYLDFVHQERNRLQDITFMYKEYKDGEDIVMIHLGHSVSFDHDVDMTAEDCLLLAAMSIFKQAKIYYKKIHRIESGKDYIKIFYTTKKSKGVDFDLKDHKLYV